MLTNKWHIFAILLNVVLSSTNAFQSLIKHRNLRLNGDGRRKSSSRFQGEMVSSRNIGLLSMSNIPDQTTRKNKIQNNFSESNYGDDNNYEDRGNDRQMMYYQSYVETVKCQNFMLNAATKSQHTNGDDDKSTRSNASNNNEVVIHLGTEHKGPNLVAVTGETGSGKSLLVFKVFQLVLGEKVSPTIMRGSSFASGEVGEFLIVQLEF